MHQRKKTGAIRSGFYRVLVLDLFLHCCLRQLDLAAGTKN